MHTLFGSFSSCCFLFVFFFHLFHSFEPNHDCFFSLVLFLVRIVCVNGFFLLDARFFRGSSGVFQSTICTEVYWSIGSVYVVCSFSIWVSRDERLLTRFCLCASSLCTFLLFRCSIDLNFMQQLSISLAFRYSYTNHFHSWIPVHAYTLFYSQPLNPKPFSFHRHRLYQMCASSYCAKSMCTPADTIHECISLNNRKKNNTNSSMKWFFVIFDGARERERASKREYDRSASECVCDEHNDAQFRQGARNKSTISWKIVWLCLYGLARTFVICFFWWFILKKYS